MVGRCPSREASRSVMDVSGSIGPMERYSAIPSMNHRGRLALTSVCTPAPMRPRLITSNWNWCTISWPITCSNSAYDPVNGSTMRCLKKSVLPWRPSNTSVMFVCWKSDCEAYKMIGFRPWNWWCRMRDRRAYHRSAMRAASKAAVRSAG